MTARQGLRFGQHEWRAVLAGILLYGGTSWLANIFPLAASENVEIRLGVAVPIFMGFAYGPFVGFFTGFLGNMVSDALSGWITYPPDPPTGDVWIDAARGFLLHWQVGNGIMGLVPGLSMLMYDRFYTWKDQLRSLAIAALAVVAGMAFASMAAMPIDGRDFQFALSQLFFPAARVNLLSAFVTVPILLYNYARLDVGSTDWFRSDLMRQLLTTILVSAALPAALLGMLLMQHTTGAMTNPEKLTAKLMLTILTSIGFAVVNAALVVQNLSRPLWRLTEAARLMKANKLTSAEAKSLEQLDEPSAPREIVQLAAVFGHMARVVIQREERLRRQVEQLRIEIDRTKQREQVSEITESDFFQNLAARAHEMRRQRHRPVKGTSAAKGAEERDGGHGTVAG